MSSNYSELDFLRASNDESGWSVSRNKRKILNHLSSVIEKEGISESLGIHSVKTPVRQLSENHRILDKFRNEKLAFEDCIKLLPADSRKLLSTYATANHVEFHSCDVCNLKCEECTYGFGNAVPLLPSAFFPLPEVYKIAQFKPKSMVIVGGGEPTLYRYKKSGFSDLISEIDVHMPGIQLALVTNGMIIPTGMWQKRFAWIRVSLDAATPQTFALFRGRPFFERVVGNFMKYLDYDIPSVGIGFVFSKTNIHEYVDVARFIFDLVKREKPQHLHKVNIQYRPLRKDPPYESFDEAISDEDIRNTVAEIVEAVKKLPEIENFLREQTNITTVTDGNRHKELEFSRCFYAEIFKIVRANGDIRPCCVNTFDPSLHLGNVITDTIEEIGFHTFQAANKRSWLCTPQNCRMCSNSHMIEQGLSGSVIPSSSIEVISDLMF